MTSSTLARTANFRDLGGASAPPLGRVRTGLVFRSGELTRLTRSENAEIEALGIRTVIDLRTDDEIRRRGAPRLSRSVRIERLPIDSGALLSSVFPTVLRGRFDEVPFDFLQRVNRSIVRNAQPQLRAVFHIIDEAQSAPLVFHCTHGKDRTGVVAASILLALGVDWSDVVADYLRSNATPTTQHRRQRAAIRRLAPLLSLRPWRRPDLRSVERLFEVAPENVEAARDEMRSLDASVDDYLERACGVDAAMRERLRQRFVAPMAELDAMAPPRSESTQASPSGPRGGQRGDA